LFLRGFFSSFSPSIYINQTDNVPNGCISAAEAYETAMPHITEYAKERAFDYGN
jgi:hypothetical protein